MTGVRDATARIDLRRKQGRRRRATTLALAGLAVAVVAALVYVVGFSPVLAVEDVQVAGTKVATADEVRQAAAVSRGTPLVQVDVAAVAERVSGLPPVAQVSVSRQWPHRVRIEVVERVPRLAVKAGTGYLVADAAGVVFDSSKSLPKGLIRVEADPKEQGVLVDTGAVYSALSAALAGKLETIEARGRDSITLHLNDGVRVFWGSVEQSELKSQVIDALLPQGGKIFDVSAPSHPTRR